ncbi:carbamoyltransferase [Streptomyces sp. A7024]|uniref:Carbamoyltransferase n=1 Tax=Streptomyces coryli TaxID=1128680 RepID=A0A6G4UAN2_9ACTN|nr:carbamoyltransferase C-terminal domain-containing protein [Streptomyces coryli]NGN69295.1 carbamoyltransferase [Streptomyces coryli]
MRVLGINALFHDPAAALVIDGETVAAAEEERFSRREHGKRPVPFAAWELPGQSAAWCLRHAGLTPGDIDLVAYSYDPALAEPSWRLGLDDPWDHLRQRYAREAPAFIAEALPGLGPEQVRFVPHHIAHAASAALAGPHDDPAVLVCDGRGESTSHLAGRYRGQQLHSLHTQPLPDSLGLVYEDLTEHLGFLRGSDEDTVLALAAHGKPRFREDLWHFLHAREDGGFTARDVPFEAYAPRRQPAEPWTQDHADLAASVQACLEDALLDLTRWLHASAGGTALALAGGVALNCGANSRIAAEGPYEHVWVQPAAGDAGTALGAAMHVAAGAGDEIRPVPGADLGRGWSDDELEAWLRRAAVPYEKPADIAGTVAEELADNGVVAWFQGRSEYGPRALGHRSLLAHPGHAANLDRLNSIQGREEFHPLAAMVTADRAAEIFGYGPLPSPYPHFAHEVAPEWRDRMPAVVHEDGTARAQTVDAEAAPEVARVLAAFEERTGLPVVVNTGLNTAGRPLADDPRDALECFGSAPVDLLALGAFAVRRGRVYA